MKKAKGDAQITKEDIEEAALECFCRTGFKGTSLEAIASEAGVTRGAIYWHFKDKKDLYKSVVKNVLEHSVVAYAYSLSDSDMDFESRMIEIFQFSQRAGNAVDFIYKAMHTISHYDNDFDDIKDEIQMEKIKLFRFFAEETRIHTKIYKVDTDADPEIIASNLFLLFEGLFLTKNLNIGIRRDEEYIAKYVHEIIKDVL